MKTVVFCFNTAQYVFRRNALGKLKLKMYFKPRYGYLVEDVLTTRISFLSVLVSDMFNIGFVMGFVCGHAEKWLGSPQGEYKSSCPVQKGEYISSTE